MFSLAPTDVLQLRSPGGDRFADFMNELIRAHARHYGIPDRSVRTNVETNMPDGGVDAEVDSTASGDITGRMATPTAWQFKAADSSPKELREEINKPYSRELVEAGYSYTFCVCDSLTPQRKGSWQSTLEQEAQKINPDAPRPQLLDANDLVAWANMYPALVLNMNQAALRGISTFQAWGRSATIHTARYVGNSSHIAKQLIIKNHVSFDQEPTEVVLAIQGPIGVGKTRLVYEALLSVSGAQGLVLYTGDGNTAREVSALLANSARSAVVVADNCTTGTIEMLREMLAGHGERVRAIAVESIEEGAQRGGRGVEWIEELDTETLAEALAANYPAVAIDRRRAYAHLSEGMIRFAVDLCRYNSEISSREILDGQSIVGRYLSANLAPPEREALAALALIDGVGMTGNVVPDLSQLAAITGVDQRELRSSVRRLREVRGLASSAGRFLYVKPPLVASIAFAEGWNRFAADSPASFLAEVATEPHLLKRFLRRVAISGSDEVRGVVARYFGQWSQDLTPQNLSSPDDVDRLVTLIEVEPHRFLPVLRRLIQNAPLDKLVAGWEQDATQRDIPWEVRRAVARAAQLPFGFHDAEEILLRLATVKLGPDESSHGAEAYRQLFWPLMSGTALPWDQRLDVLSRRLRADNPDIVSLALQALGDVFRRNFSRALDSPLVAGRIADEWEPATEDEFRSGLADAVALLKRVVGHESAGHRSEAWGVAIPHLGDLVQLGFAEDLAEIFPADSLPDDIRFRLVIEIERYLARERYRHRGSTINKVVGEDQLVMLLKAVRPKDLHGRLVAAVGEQRWQRTGPDEGWHEELELLAQELKASQENFRQEIDWLCSAEAPGAYELGSAFARRDPEGEAVQIVLHAARSHPSARFAIGYVAGLAEQYSAPVAQLNNAIDQLEEDSPALAFELALSGGKPVRAAERVFRLVAHGSVPVENLFALSRGIKGDALSLDEIEAALSLLIRAASERDNRSAQAALEIATTQALREHESSGAQAALESPAMRDLLWDLVRYMAIDPGQRDQEWNALLEALTPFDTKRAAAIAVLALGSESHWQRRGVGDFLTRLTEDEAGTVMVELGERIIAEFERGVQAASPYRHILARLPVEIVRRWIEGHGADGADAIAPHLPRPYRTGGGDVCVPETTGWVLEVYGDREAVFSGFYHGSLVWGEEDATDDEGRLLTTDLTRMTKLATVANELLAHPNPMLRQWARKVNDEVGRLRQFHNRWDQEIEELRFRR